VFVCIGYHTQVLQISGKPNGTLCFIALLPKQPTISNEITLTKVSVSVVYYLYYYLKRI
jgi:hypothetical protein